MSEKIVKVLINPDGTVEFDQIGWTGKKCSGEIKDLIDARFLPWSNSDHAPFRIVRYFT